MGIMNQEIWANLLLYMARITKTQKALLIRNMLYSQW